MSTPSAAAVVDRKTYGSTTIDSDPQDKPRTLYLFGYPAKSLAPLLHNAVFAGLKLPWTFHNHETPDMAECLRLMRRDDFVGAAVTIPHKIPFLQEMDVVTEEAEVIGAMNTIFVRLGSDGKRRYIGTNTDHIGVKDSLLKYYPRLEAQVKGQPALVLGGGGAARAAIYALYKGMGVEDIYLVNRDDKEIEVLVESFSKTELEVKLLHVESVEQAKSLEVPLVAVSCVPNYSPVTPQEKLAREIVVTFLEKEQIGGVALDLCYHPKMWTEFALLAKEKGWETVLGTEVMIYQAVDQDLSWTERPVEEMPLDEVARIVRDAAT